MEISYFFYLWYYVVVLDLKINESRVKAMKLLIIK